MFNNYASHWINCNTCNNVILNLDVLEFYLISSPDNCYLCQLAIDS